MWLFCDYMFEESSFLEDMQIIDFTFDLSSHLKCVQGSSTIFSIKQANLHHHLCAQLPALQEGIWKQDREDMSCKRVISLPPVMITKGLVHRVRLSSSGKQAARN